MGSIEPKINTYRLMVVELYDVEEWLNPQNPNLWQNHIYTEIPI